MYAIDGRPRGYGSGLTTDVAPIPHIVLRLRSWGQEGIDEDSQGVRVRRTRGRLRLGYWIEFLEYVQAQVLAGSGWLGQLLTRYLEANSRPSKGKDGPYGRKEKGTVMAQMECVQLQYGDADYGRTGHESNGRFHWDLLALR